MLLVCLLSWSLSLCRFDIQRGNAAAVLLQLSQFEYSVIITQQQQQHVLYSVLLSIIQKNKDTIRILCSLQYVALRCVAFPLVHLSASFHFVSSSSSFNGATLQCSVSFSRRRTGLRVVFILQEYVSSWYQQLSHHHRSLPLIAVTRNP